jgi:hypothetical protein
MMITVQKPGDLCSKKISWRFGDLKLKKLEIWGFRDPHLLRRQACAQCKHAQCKETLGGESHVCFSGITINLWGAKYSFCNKCMKSVIIGHFLEFFTQTFVW